MKKAVLVLVTAVVSVLGYIVFDNVVTPDAVVIEEVMGVELYSGHLVMLIQHTRLQDHLPL